MMLLMMIIDLNEDDRFGLDLSSTEHTEIIR